MFSCNHLRDQQVERFNDVAAVCLCMGLPGNRRSMRLVGDEFSAAPQVSFADIEARGFPERALEFGYAHQCLDTASFHVNRR